MSPRQQLSKHSRGSWKQRPALLAGAPCIASIPHTAGNGVLIIWDPMKRCDVFSFWSAGLPARVERRGK